MLSVVPKAKAAIIWVYNQSHWFTDKEAWWIYRLGAVLETIGWTLLIGAIVYRRLEFPYADSVVSVAGRIHGIFFVCYFGAVIATARSMQWGFWRVIFGLGAGVPPFTAIIFEQIMAYDRRKRPVYVTPPPRDDDD